MIFSQWIRGSQLLLAGAVIVVWSTHAGAAAASSCVKCHLDEEMLTDNLAQVKTKASAMQSGAG